MKKIVLILGIIGLFAMSLLQVSGEPNELKLMIDDEYVEFTQETGYPFIDENGRTLVPFRGALESFGADVSWENSSRQAVAKNNGIIVEVPVNKNYIFVDKHQVTMDTMAIIKDGRTYLPIRYVLESLGAKVSWLPESKTIYVARNDVAADVPSTQNEEVEIEEEVDKNIFTNDYLQQLVDSTESKPGVEEFRKKSNSRRNGLLKVEGKYFDMYYPNDDYGQEVADLLSPHMDKVYMMLADIYGVQTTVEVHLIHEKDTAGLKEGEIRARERVTYVWLEPNNDDGGNNLSEFVHEVNHNFFDEANGGSTNEMWINEANAKLISSLYMEHNYDGHAEMWSHYEINQMARGLREQDISMDLKRANEILRVARAWSRADGEKKLAQTYGLYLWTHIYNNYELAEHNEILRNLGTGDVVKKLEELLGMSSQEISAEIQESIETRAMMNQRR